jgi:HD-like signal output (HDOD) protein
MREGVSMHVAERREGLPSHDEVGAILAYEWRLPVGLRAVIECHHQIRSDRSPGFSDEAHTHVDIVAAADSVCRHLAIGHPGDPYIPPLDAPPIDRFGLNRDELPGIKALIAAKTNTSKVFAALLNDTL